LSAGVAGMTDEAETTELLASSSCDGRKNGLRAPTKRGVEVRVRPIRRRSWLDEDKLRMVRETLKPGVVVQAVVERNGVSTGQL
jgi:transposase